MMMAVRAPLGLSPSNPLMSAFSPFSENPDSPRPRGVATSRSTMASTERESYLKPSQPTSTNIFSPQDPVAPSPIASEVGTEFADVDEEVEEEKEEEQESQRPNIPTVKVETQPSPPQSQPQPPAKEIHRGPSLRLNTTSITPYSYPPRQQQDYEAEPQSVIHAPAGFGTFEQTRRPKPEPERKHTPPSQDRPDLERARADSTESVKSDVTVTKAEASEVSQSQKTSQEPPAPPSPLQTTLPIAQDWSSTPRAQTRQDLGVLSRPGSGLSSIMERDDTLGQSTDDAGNETDASEAVSFFRTAHDEILALKNALSECWTLCNTLASLSYIHRERMFNFAGKGDMQQQAWKTCWKLCQNLYETRDETTCARPTLDLCREFCQALFEVRVRDNETADSVLRVSFELNTHLFNTHDRALPEAFRERTLDFYITLCHRLMKQKSRVAEESDSLLRACWSLAEMLFSLRQNKREGKNADEELLGSAVQACWELCDLFREGWTQIRPERGTPRPSQTTFTQAFNQAKRSGFVPLDENGNPKPLPETPTTIFEDTINTISPDEAPVPNILVLGAHQNTISNANSFQLQSTNPQIQYHQPQPQRFPQSAHPTTQRRFWSSSTTTITTGTNPLPTIPDLTSTSSSTMTNPTRTPEDPMLTLLTTLFIKAAVSTNRGYTRTSSDPNLNSLPQFTKSLPDTAFGTQVWQVSLLDNYRKTIANDPVLFRNLGVAAILGEKNGGRVNAVEVARAVKGMTGAVYGFAWLRDLYRFVFGFYVEEALKGEDLAGQGAAKGPAGGRAVNERPAGMGSGSKSGSSDDGGQIVGSVKRSRSVN